MKRTTMRVMTRYLLMLTITSAIGCGTGSTTPDPKPVEAPVEVEPVEPEVVLTTEARLMAELCPAELLDGEVCNGCPGDTQLGQESQGDAQLEMTIVAVREGSYTSKGATEYVVELLGCAFPDGSTEGVLMSETDGELKVEARSGLLSVKTCKFPTDAAGAELMVCMSSGGKQGFLVSDLRQLDARDGLREVSIKSLMSNSGSCPTETLQDEISDGFRLIDINQDGLDDVVFDYTSLIAKVPEPYADSCEARNKGYDFGEQDIHEDVFIQRDGAFVPE